VVTQLTTPTNLAPQLALCHLRRPVGTALLRWPCLRRVSRQPSPRPRRVSTCRLRRRCNSWRAEARSIPSSTSTAHGGRHIIGIQQGSTSVDRFSPRWPPPTQMDWRCPPGNWCLRSDPNETIRTNLNT
jgi:hypothetical protein